MADYTVTLFGTPYGRDGESAGVYTTLTLARSAVRANLVGSQRAEINDAYGDIVESYQVVDGVVEEMDCSR